MEKAKAWEDAGLDSSGVTSLTLSTLKNIFLRGLVRSAASWRLFPLLQ